VKPEFCDDDFKLWSLLNQVNTVMSKARSRELLKFGVTAVEASVLFCVKSGENKVTPAQISQWTLRERHSISAEVTRMEKKGLIKKVKDLRYRNHVRILLTDKGEILFSKSLQRDSIERMLKALSKPEKRQIRLSLEKLREAALFEVGNNKMPSFPIFDA
jgi:DNA-binding MarR family transcriptional regulator